MSGEKRRKSDEHPAAQAFRDKIAEVRTETIPAIEKLTKETDAFAESTRTTPPLQRSRIEASDLKRWLNVIADVIQQAPDEPTDHQVDRMLAASHTFGAPGLDPHELADWLITMGEAIVKRYK